MNPPPWVIEIHGDAVTIEAATSPPGWACQWTGSGPRCGGVSSTVWLSAVRARTRGGYA
jgi:hypothetical protein